MPELDGVSIARIKLPHGARKSRTRVAVTRRKLEEKAAELRAENLFEAAEFLDEHSGANHALLVRDQPVHFDGVAEVFRRIAHPAFHGAELRPAVKGCVQLHRVERRGVMLEPRVGPLRIWIKNPAPVPIEPA